MTRLAAACILLSLPLLALAPRPAGAELPLQVGFRPPAHLSLTIREQLIRDLLDHLKYPVTMSQSDERLQLPSGICGKFPGETFRGVSQHQAVLEEPTHARVRFADNRVWIDLRLRCNATYEIYHRFYRESARHWKRTERVRVEFVAEGTVSARPEIVVDGGRQKLRLPFRCERVDLKDCPGWMEKLLGLRKRVQNYFDTAINPQAEYPLPALPLPFTGKQFGPKNVVLRSEAGALHLETDFGLTSTSP